MDPPSEAYRIQLTVRLALGMFPDDDRKAIVAAFRDSDLGQVRIDEAVVTNLGAGGPGGLPITFDVWLNIGEQAAGALLALAIAKGIAPVVKIVGRRLARLQAIVHKDDGEPVTFLADQRDAAQALDAMPADYELTVRSESHTRIWRNGKWDHFESDTRIERGGGA